MTSYKATYDRGDGRKMDVTVIGVNNDGVVFINNTNGGQFGVDHPNYFTAEPYLDSMIELSLSVDNLIREIQGIQTYGLRLNK
jgi:hypothetical protein